MNDKQEQQKKAYLERFSKEVRLFDDDLIDRLRMIIYYETIDRSLGDAEND